MPRKKTKSIKAKKERLMPFKQQVSRLKAYLDKEGIPVHAGEIEDLVDPTLHYSENKSALEEMFGIGVARISDIDVLIQQAEARDAARSERARIVDWHKRAKHTWTPRQLIKDPEKADKWFNDPNRYDIVGIDVKEGVAVIRHKKRKKKVKKKGKAKEKKKENNKYPYRSKRKMIYHDREGFPIIHQDEKSGKEYVMVRKKGGGTKRLYDFKRYMKK